MNNNKKNLDLEKLENEEELILQSDGLIKEVNKKVYVRGNDGKKKQLLKEQMYEIN